MYTDTLYPYLTPGCFDIARAWTLHVISKSGYDTKSIYQTATGSQSSMLVSESKFESQFLMRVVQPGSFNHGGQCSSRVEQIHARMFRKPHVVDMPNFVMTDYGTELPDEVDMAKSGVQLFRCPTLLGKDADIFAFKKAATPGHKTSSNDWGFISTPCQADA